MFQVAHCLLESGLQVNVLLGVPGELGRVELGRLVPQAARAVVVVVVLDLDVLIVQFAGVLVRFVILPFLLLDHSERPLQVRIQFFA